MMFWKMKKMTTIYYDDEEDFVDEPDDIIEYESKFDNDNDDKYEDIEKETLKNLQTK